MGRQYAVGCGVQNGFQLLFTIAKFQFGLMANADFPQKLRIDPGQLAGAG